MEDVEKPHFQAIFNRRIYIRFCEIGHREARPDIRTQGFYSAGQQAFFDVKMLNPNSYVKIPTTKVYQNAEQAKKSFPSLAGWGLRLSS